MQNLNIPDGLRGMCEALGFMAAETDLARAVISDAWYDVSL